MTAPPLPAADVAPLVPGTPPTSPAAPAGASGGVPNASEFAALLQEAGLAAELPAADERIESRPDAPPEGASLEGPPPSAFEGLLFLAALNPPAAPWKSVQAALEASVANAAVAPSTVTSVRVDVAALPIVASGAETVDRLGARAGRVGGAPLLASSTDAAQRSEPQSRFGGDASDDGMGTADKRFVPAPELPSAFADAIARKTDPTPLEAKLATAPAVPESPLVAAPATPLARPPVAIEIATPVHDPAWRAEAMGRIASLVTRGVDHAELRLSPAELGPVEVRIDVRGGETTLAIVATQPATRDALEQALPLLREMLSQQGLSLGETSVRDGRADGGANRDGSAAGRQGTGAQFEPLASEAPAVPRAPLIRRLVDVFA